MWYNNGQRYTNLHKSCEIKSTLHPYKTFSFRRDAFVCSSSKVSYNNNNLIRCIAGKSSFIQLLNTCICKLIVYCILGNIIQNRISASSFVYPLHKSFNRSVKYQFGFKNPDDDFWLGLSWLYHTLLKRKYCSIRFELWVTNFYVSI